MRRRIFILLAAAGLLGPAAELSAQRCLPGQTGVQLGGGACGGFLLRDGYGAWSFHAELSVVRYVRKTRYWEFGVSEKGLPVSGSDAAQRTVYGWDRILRSRCA